jgi:DNA-binding transcriptional ArsR family regulator
MWSFMAFYSPKPGEVILVIKALADPTRRKMLLLMHENSPRGLTASHLADELDKKIPTILHHLEKLEDLDLAHYVMEKIAGGHREVKHWKVKHQKFVLEVDMDSISTEGFIPDKYILTLFEEEKGAGGSISTDFVGDNQPEVILQKLKRKYPEVSLRKAEVIHAQLSQKEDLLQYLEKWIYNEFTNSAGELQLDFFEFGSHFALDDNLRRELFEKLMHSGNFSLYAYGEDGRPIQRVAIRREYLEEIKNKNSH